nr:MAG TPA: hypothetical protein [Caudoviricetes sp.]
MNRELHKCRLFLFGKIKLLEWLQRHEYLCQMFQMQM